ncbi:MAG: PD-(D/E)XK nuclease family protein, partial [Elusimicrobiota bacterium]|nr:PD-(D/E)XK nuclease family protein [Elusimicrobiota bacterium]
VPAPGLAAAEAAAAALADRSAPAGPFDGRVRPVAAEAAEWRRRGLSPSALDELAACPFRFFAGRVLGLPEPEEAAERGELDAATRGRLYHAVLERAKDDGLERALVEVFSANDWRVLGLYPLLWEALREEMSVHLRAFAEWDAEDLAKRGMRPRWSEKALEGAPPEGAPGGVPWRGKLDRVETDPATRRFRVTDFKTKRSARWAKPAKAVEAGETHQLPVYAELAAAALGPGWTFDGASYRFVETADAREAELTAADWSALRAPFFARLARRLEEAADGRFPIRPDDRDPGHCTYCGFAAACRKAHSPSRTRAERLIGA